LPARATVLATGGAAALWPLTTNPATSTGDGVALAYDAGAEIAGMEFMQFHPTALATGDSPRFLISEALRGAGAIVVNEAGHRFLLDVDERGELAGRDVVARAIWDELRRSGAPHVFLDCTTVADAAARFPAIHAACAAHGLLLERDRIPILPAAHYTIGGVRTDVHGATNVPGLYACGEVASTGVHGANRLASNSLLESAVFGSRAGIAACAGIAEAPEPARHHELAPIMRADAGEDAWHTLRAALWNGAGILREANGLRRSLAECEAIRDGRAAANDASLRASATTATLVCSGALQREETRGCHIRVDHPHSREQLRGDIVMHRERGARRVDCT
jgi:L-aspartate oxidase